MKEITGNLWDYYGATGYCTVCDGPYSAKGDTPYCAQRHIAIETVVQDAKFVVCITTNGTVKKNGEAVMGRGCAFEAAQRFPGLAKNLGSCIKVCGNEFEEHLIPGKLASFPVKHQWWQEADLGLIEESAGKLWVVADDTPETVYILPRPGCGNGRLTWEQVKPVIEFLPDNVWVISKG